MSPVPGATSVMATVPTPAPSTNATVTMATTTTFTSSAPNRNPTVSSQQRHYSPSRAQHGSGNGNGNVSMAAAASKNKQQHFNNNNNITNSTNCNSNNNNNSGKVAQSHNKLTFQQKQSGISLERVGSMHQMKQQQQQFNKNSNNAMNAKANDMQKQKTVAKSSFTHATTTATNSSAVNGADTKSVNNKGFSTPVGTSSPPSSSSSAPTNCSTKSLMTTKTTTHKPTTAAVASSQAADPLALPAIKCNGVVTSTPASTATVVTNAPQITTNSTINQVGMEIKGECDPQMIGKAEQTATTKTAAATPTTTTSQTTVAATIVNQKTMSSSTTTPLNRKDSTVATTTEAKKNKNAGGSTNHTTTDDASVDNVIVDKPRKVLLSVMNSHIICHLCNGYLIDATTIVECLHSFCHSCLIKHLRMEQYCPRCEMMINTAKPNIKPDTTLQAIVYKLVPGLYERELMRKRAFYKDRPEDAAIATPEQRGEDTEHLIFSPSDYMSLSLEFADTDELVRRKSDYGELLKPRYLQCPAMCTVEHLKKFVYGKFDIDVQRFDIDLMYKVKTIVLLDHYTLMDVAYIYTWKRDAPMRFYFRVKRSSRPIVKVRKPASIMPVEVKDEAADVKVTPLTKPETTEAASTTTTPAVVPDAAMTIIPKPVVSALSVNEPLIKAPVEIKPEAVEVPEEATPKTIPEASAKPAKTSKTLKSPTVSSSTDGKQRSQVSSSTERRAEKAHHSHGTPKTSSKEKREAKEALKHATETPPRDERKVENIKLKIDLSKHNSVTIINMSDPHRREVTTKPVRPEKEWKLKTKRDKDSSPKHLLNSERKIKTPSPLTVPPITIKAEQISPQTKTSPLARSNPHMEEKSPEPENEEQKSEFLKSFSLTPIKSVKTESPDKSPQSPKRSPNTIQTHKILVKSPTSAAREPLKTTISAVYKTSALPAKRKIKELGSKHMAKKPKLSPPLPAEDFKIKLPPASASNNATKPSSATPPKSNAVTNDKSAAPTTKPASNLTATKTADSTTNSSTSNLSSFRPPIGVPPKKPTAKSGSSAPKLNSMAPPPLPFQRIEMSAPGNRTPIAKRYQPILPKASRPNPFANIPSDVNRLLKDAGTEIKSIASNAKSTGKVYGPKSSGGGSTSITPEDSLMLPPPSPVKAQSPNINQTRLGGAGNANKSTPKNAKSSSANNYLNLALYNASKTKGNEAPPGCRTPMYTPNSPIYSPSSPQYVPNYNIPTVPTYKYTPRPSSGGSSFLQSILGGSNNQMAGLFPAPPTKKETSNPNANSTTGRSSPSHGGQQKSFDGGKQQHAPKRVYPFARSPSPEDPPEKQLKVKSLLTSCNINIPSSLSITITREDSESPTNNASYPKHKSPVNNYIEILKLPDQSCETAEQTKRASPPAQKQAPTQQSAAALKLLMPPSVNSATSTRRDSTDAAQVAHKTQNKMPAPKTSHSNAQSNTHKQSSAPLNKSTKSPQANPTNSAQNHPMLIAHITEPQKSPQSVQQKSATEKPPQSVQHKSTTEKRSPMHSPEKSVNVSPNSKSAHKSPSSSASNEASKKFRPILPRQNPASAISEVVPPKVTTANIIGTYSSPSGVAVKIHANKKVTPPKKSPGAQQTQQTHQQPQNAHQQPKSGHSPNALNATKGGATQAHKSPTPAHQSSNKLQSNTTKSTPSPTPNASSTTSSNASAKNNKLMHSPHPGMPTSLPSLPSLPAMQNMPPPTPLQVAAMAAGLPGMPPHLSADFSKLFKDNLLRAQVQAAAAASQPGGMFYPYANPQQLSHHYSYQQAFMLEQLSRMQRAEAINEFMQKLKNGSAEKLALENMAASVVAGGKAAANVDGSPKVSSPVTSSSSGTSKSNSGKNNASAASPNSSNNNINSSIGTSATKAK